jgi:translation initiation factor IF-3
VRVIDGTNNAQLGVMSPGDALRRARAMGLDLVEVAATADPPVCRICDYGKWKYEQAKQQKNKAKTTKLKEVKFRVGIDPHDYHIKLARGERFLGEGHKLRVQVMFRGRQMAHPELGMELIRRVIEDLKTMGHADVTPRQAGRSIGTMFSPLPKHLRKPRFSHIEDDGSEEEDDEEDDQDEELEENDETEKRQPKQKAPPPADEPPPWLLE